MSFARTESLNGSFQRCATLRQFFVLSELGVMASRGIGKSLECITHLGRVVDPGIQGDVTAQPTIHIHDVTLRYLETFRNCFDLIRSQIAIIESRNRALGSP